MERRLPVSGEIKGLNRIRERWADTESTLRSKWNGAAVATMMKSVVTAQSIRATRDGSRIGRSGRETVPDSRRFVRQKSPGHGILAFEYGVWNASSARKRHGYRYLGIQRRGMTASEAYLR